MQEMEDLRKQISTTQRWFGISVEAEKTWLKAERSVKR